MHVASVLTLSRELQDISMFPYLLWYMVHHTVHVRSDELFLEALESGTAPYS